MIDRYLEMAKSFFGASHPLFNTLGVEVEEICGGKAVMTICHRKFLTGRNGSMHRGVIVTLLDTNCGLAIFSKLGDMRAIATIDLRVDFIAEAVSGDSVSSEVECYAIKNDIAYVRGRAINNRDDRLLATVSGSFAVGTLGPGFDSSMQ